MDVYKGTTTKFDVPLDHLDFQYVKKCTNAKELEKIVRVLRSGVEGTYPELEKEAESRLFDLKPQSKVLRKEKPISTPGDLNKQEWATINKDLTDWTTEMSNSDLQSNGDVGVEAVNDLPPVRGSSSNIPFSKETSNQPDKNQSTKRPMPRNHKEWDKVDIDAELAKVDQEETKTNSNQSHNVLSNASPVKIPSSINTADMTDEEKERKAQQEKNKGNEAFSSGDYDEALLYYSRSLSISPSLAAHNNRAQTYVKMKRWDEAILDCNAVLSMEPANIKGLLRRAVAFNGRRDFVKAKQDLEVVLGAEPGNKRAKDVLKDVEKAMSEQKVKGRRMVIEEVEGSDSDEEKTNVMQTDVKDSDNKANVMDKQTDITENTSEAGVKTTKSNDAEPSPYVVDSTPVIAEQNASEPMSSSTTHTETFCAPPPEPVLPPPPPTPLPSDVEVLKNEGTDFYKAGRYADAEIKYTKAINRLWAEGDGHKPNLSVLYSNRAACHTKMGACSRCIDDCTEALKLTPGAVKPLLRRAAAYEADERYRKAYIDYHFVLRKDSSVFVANQGANRCQAVLRQLDGINWRDKLQGALGGIGDMSAPVTTSTSTDSVKKTEQVKTVNKQEVFDKVKAEGNDLVKKGDYAAAIKCYSQCIALVPEQTAPFTNRALCYLKLNQAEKALEDCDIALAKESNNVKALFRKAQALKMQNNFMESMTVLKRLIEIDPKNNIAKRELTEVTTQQEKLEKSKKTSGRRRVPIQEVDSSSDDSDDSPVHTANKGKSINKENLPDSTETKKNDAPVITEIQSEETKSPDQPTGRKKAQAKRRKKKSASKKSPPQATVPTMENVTGYEFMKTWQGLKSSQNIQLYADLLVQVEPKMLTKVLSNKLEGDMLRTLVMAAHRVIQSGEADNGWQYIQELTDVPRFQVISMLMSDTEKRDVKKVFDELSAEMSTVSLEEMTRIKKLYGQ